MEGGTRGWIVGADGADGLGRLSREQLDTLVTRLVSLELPAATAARAAARLLTLGAPITDGLLRGGALAESAVYREANGHCGLVYESAG